MSRWESGPASARRTDSSRSLSVALAVRRRVRGGRSMSSSQGQGFRDPDTNRPSSRLLDYRFCRSLPAQRPQSRCLADQRKRKSGRLTGMAQKPGTAFECRKGLLKPTAGLERSAERDQHFAICAVEPVLSLERRGSRREKRLLLCPA